MAYLVPSNIRSEFYIMSDLYVGLMSGTSIDGIDAVLVNFNQPHPVIMSTHYTPYPLTLREKIKSLCSQGENEIQRLGELDIQLGKEFAEAVNSLLNNASISPQSIKAIGSHGQTVRHFPHGGLPFTLQIGDPNTISARTGITTIADFRRKDMALGGQGAPLVPAFHQYLFVSHTHHRIIVNIGGISNITILPKNTSQLIGFDTGPGNVLMDAFIFEHLQKTHDEQGDWARNGRVQTRLLSSMLQDEFFKLSPPKSTGREYFNLSWLKSHLHNFNETFSAVDIQATLAELTATSILQSILNYFSSGEIIVCGGGAHNTYLMSRIQELSQGHFSVHSTEHYGFNPNWIEATAFAWLAKQTLNQQTGNIPSVTGAKKASILGGIYYP